MKPFFDFHHIVTDEEIDNQRHVHNLRYLQWTLWAAGAHTSQLGWDSAAALKRGFGWVVRSHEATYRAPAMAGDRIVVRTWVSDLSRFASRRKYILCRPSDQTVVTRVETRWVYVDLNDRRVIAIPDEVSALMTVVEKTPPLPWEEAHDY